MSRDPCPAEWNKPQVLVDDADPRIKYGAGWYDDIGESTGTFGSSLYDTTHRLKITNTPSAVNFTFKGTSASVLGDLYWASTNGLSEDQPVDLSEAGITTTCLVDGQTAGPSMGPDVLCGADNLSDGEHQISWSAVTSKGNSLVVAWVDAIQYTPSSTDQVEGNDVLIVDACNSDVDFDHNLDFFTSFTPPSNSTIEGLPLGIRERYNGIQTNAIGGQLNFTFKGSKAQWMTTLLPDSSHKNPASAKWIIDNNPEWSDTIEIPSPTNSTAYNHILFDTPNLSPQGTHTLSVSYIGDADSLPLTLSYFYVYNGKTIDPSSTTDVSHGHNRTGTIIGSVLGSLGALALVLVVGWVVYHRRQRGMEKKTWDAVWKKRQHQPEALEMNVNSPRPEKV